MHVIGFITYFPILILVISLLIMVAKTVLIGNSGSRHPLLTAQLIGSISKVSSLKCNFCHSSDNFYEVTDIFQIGSITPNQILYNFSRVSWERKPEVCAHSISRQEMLNFEIYFYYIFNFLTFVCVFI